MAIHKLHIEEFDEADYTLLAIHTSLEAYRLAYFINQKLPVRLSHNPDEIHIKARQGETSFPRFSYKNDAEETAWDLIGNKSEIDAPTPGDLFATQSVSVTAYLLPEFRNADYFLKVDHCPLQVETLAQGINTIPQVAAVYPVAYHTIRSKNNLIF